MNRSQFALVVALSVAAPAPAAPQADGAEDSSRSAADRAARVESRKKGDRTVVTLRGFESVEVGQAEPVWCWAACAEMILRYHGAGESQADIAARIHGYEGDLVKVAAASRFEVYRALCPEAARSPFAALADRIVADLGAAAAAAASQGGGGSISVQVRVEQAAQVALDQFAPAKGVPVELLERGHPAVVGMRAAPGDPMGHLYVLVGATYRERGAFERTLGDIAGDALAKLAPDARETIERFAPSKYDVVSVVLVDPLAHDDPSTEADEMRVELKFDDFARRVDFVTTRADARAILERWCGVAKVRVKGR